MTGYGRGAHHGFDCAPVVPPRAAARRVAVPVPLVDFAIEFWRHFATALLGVVVFPLSYVYDSR